MRLRTWLLLLFGSLLLLTGISLSFVAKNQARHNLLLSLENQMAKGARPSFEPDLLGNLRVLSHRITDNPSVHEYRSIFVTLNGPYQQLQEQKPKDSELLPRLGNATHDDGKAWTASTFDPEQPGLNSQYYRCWQALQGLQRDIGVTLFEQAEGNLQLMILTDRQGSPFLELRSADNGELPKAENDWLPPQLTPQLLQFLNQSSPAVQEGYYLHGDGYLYLIHLEAFRSGGHLVVGTRLSDKFEQRLGQQILGAEFRVQPGRRSDAFLAAIAKPVNQGQVEVDNEPYLVHREVLPAFFDGKTEIGQLWQFRTLSSVESYLRSVTRGIATLSVGALGLGLLGIWLATRAVSDQIGRLSSSMKQVGEGHLEGELPPAGPLEVREATLAFNQMVQQLRHKEMLAKMVPKQAREAIEQEQTQGGRVVARRIRSTILFSDIRGFTSLSERLPPQEVMEMLDIYLSRMTTVIEEQGGDVNEYIGDAILADFEDRPGSPGALRAVRAAWAMGQALEEMRGQDLHPEIKTLHQGLGLHTGELLKGEVGASHRSKFALIGDTVNLAARIQDRSRDGKHSGILMSDDSQRDVTGFELVVFGDEAFKGKTGLIRVWEVVRPCDVPAEDCAAPADEKDPTGRG